jgi:hypothetical protein
LTKDSKDNQLDEKKKLEDEIISLRKKLAELENKYYEKYLNGEGD